MSGGNIRILRRQMTQRWEKWPINQRPSSTMRYSCRSVCASNMWSRWWQSVRLKLWLASTRVSEADEGLTQTRAHVNSLTQRSLQPSAHTVQPSQRLGVVYSIYQWKMQGLNTQSIFFTTQAYRACASWRHTAMISPLFRKYRSRRMSC